MDEKYIIGVDAGGTKTDYLLFTEKGRWVDSLHTGSRSHEVLPGGFAEVEEAVLADLNTLLARNSISSSQILAAVFGMAGVDTPSQQIRMTQILTKAGFAKLVVSNDSVLGIKAGSTSGIGICSINGTGTSVTGINEKGEILQVGGMGFTSGDSAGGAFLASLVLRAVYDQYFRCGPVTILADRIMELFGIHDPIELMDVINEKFHAKRDWDRDILINLFQAANTGDKVAITIVRETAFQLAKSVAGCMKVLGFAKTPEVVLAGSIWVKSNCPLLKKYFKDYVHKLSGRRISPVLLQVIPAAGAVIWALELIQDQPATPEQRALITEEVESGSRLHR